MVLKLLATTEVAPLIMRLFGAVRKMLPPVSCDTRGKTLGIIAARLLHQIEMLLVLTCDIFDLPLNPTKYSEEAATAGINQRINEGRGVDVLL